MRFIAVVFSLCLPVTASAALIIDVSGTPGSGQTTWSFTGDFVYGGTPSNPASWFKIGDYIPVGGPDNDFFNFNAGGTTQLVGSTSGLLAITGVYLDDDGVSDDFRFLPEGPGSSHPYAIGETLTFSGTSTLFVDLNSFNLGTYTEDNGYPLQLTFSQAPVPEPTSIALWGIGLLGMGIVAARRRRRKQA
jgi:hypothetical protein